MINHPTPHELAASLMMLVHDRLLLVYVYAVVSFSTLVKIGCVDTSFESYLKVGEH